MQENNKENRNPLNKIKQPPPKLTFAEKREGKEAIESLFLNDESKKTIHKVTSRYIWWIGHATLIVVLFVITIRAYHFLAPECWKWISPDGIKALDNVIIGVFAGLIARVFPTNRK